MKPLNTPKGGGRSGGRFSQQTLPGFGPQDIRPSDEHRWPEGYSPERRREVQQRLVINQVGGGPTSSWGQTPKRSWSAEEQGDKGPSLGDKRVIAAVARSSAPASDLKDSRQPNSPFSRLTVNVGGQWDGAAGWYLPRDGTVNVAKSTDLHPEAERADVLLHEIGHSVSNLTSTPHSIRSVWEHERETGMEHPMTEEVRHGQEEAFADNYAAKHRGGRRGEELPQFSSAYEKPGTIGRAYGLDSVRSSIADREYAQARTPATAKVQPKGAGQFFETPLFGRNADRFETDTQQDYGQFGWFSNADRSGGKLDSIRLGDGPPRTPVLQPGFHGPDVQTVSDTEDPSIKQRYVDAVKGGDTKAAHLIAKGEASMHPLARDKANQRRMRGGR